MIRPINEIYAVLWSGGKDSCLALWRARQSGLRVDSVLNLFDESSGRIRFHAVRATLIAEQARQLGVQIFQYGTQPDSFAADLARALYELKARGYAGIIAGDIHLADVRQLNEELATAAGLQLIEPLWHCDGRQMLEEFVQIGFRAVLTCCDDRWASVLWPGREIDQTFIDDVSLAAGLDPSGELGEYHSFVFDGPLFSHPLGWTLGEMRRSNGFSQIDLLHSSIQASCA
jgi:diphthine-ammonia ligase